MNVFSFYVMIITFRLRHVTVAGAKRIAARGFWTLAVTCQ